MKLQTNVGPGIRDKHTPVWRVSGGSSQLGDWIRTRWNLIVVFRYNAFKLDWGKWRRRACLMVLPEIMPFSEKDRELCHPQSVNYHMT